ncbi:MAG: hypothetical protein HC876_14985 [Chloroflexaceae bacterium]|nr:hypothetical protein [Chloroflexaceae bacterium]NJO06714.1 hypothetical protein [Chloroflexaceae bacterium]
MEFLVILLTLICYVAAVFLWWYHQTPLYLLTLVSGQVGSLASPLWTALYESSYRSNLSIFGTILGQPVYSLQVIAATWYYTLPALVVYFLYRSRWWFSGYFTALLTYGGFLFYHTILESIGLRSNIWNYTTQAALRLACRAH